jgi:hypothetical protein
MPIDKPRLLGILMKKHQVLEAPDKAATRMEIGKIVRRVNEAYSMEREYPVPDGLEEMFEDFLWAGNVLDIDDDQERRETIKMLLDSTRDIDEDFETVDLSELQG